MCCSPFQIILGNPCHAMLLEDVVTGLFLYGRLTTALIAPGDRPPPTLLLPQLGLPGLQLQTGLLTYSLERRKGSLGYSLSSCHAPRSIVVEAKPSSSVFPSCILSYKSKGHSIVELICKTQKRVVEIPNVMVNLCLSWTDQNGLGSECLRGTVWTSFLVLCFPFVRIVGRNNTWSF